MLIVKELMLSSILESFLEAATRSVKLQALACNDNKKETLVFSCEFCKMFKNTFLTEHLRETAFGF